MNPKNTHVVSLCKTGCFLALGLFLASSVSGQVVYQELFTNTGTGNLAVNTIGWSAYSGATAGNQSASNATDYLSNAQGDGRSAQAGYLNMAYSSTYVNAAAFDTIAGGLSLTSGATISWIMNSNSVTTVPTVRLMVQSSGSWYVSAPTFTPYSGGGGTSAYFTNATTVGNAAYNPSLLTASLTFDVTASNWYNFTLTQGTGMSVGSLAAGDISSDITGIGFYMAGASSAGNVRFDTLTITVPEPSTVALLAAFGACVLGAAYRKRLNNV